MFVGLLYRCDRQTIARGSGVGSRSRKSPRYARRVPAGIDARDNCINACVVYLFAKQQQWLNYINHSQHVVSLRRETV